MLVAESKELIRAENCDLTILRRKRGRGFEYFDACGEKIRDKGELKRLRELVIPPMWQEVRICALTEGHIQATGRDAKGRKQYIYHPEWQRQRSLEKFARLEHFGQQLPGMRRICYAHLSDPPSSRTWILSLLLLILDETGIRIGNREYQRRNNTVGLTTLRRKHMHIEEGHAVFDFQGKHGKEREVELDDEKLVKEIRKASELPGYELFRYRDKSGKWENVDSEDVNDFIHEHLGEEFSAKDFRTWVACRLAIEEYETALEEHKANPRKKFLNILIDRVCSELGNTRAICRDYYIHPALLDHIERKTLPNLNRYKDEKAPHGYSASEKLLLKIM